MSELRIVETERPAAQPADANRLTLVLGALLAILATRGAARVIAFKALLLIVLGTVAILTGGVQLLKILLG